MSRVLTTSLLVNRSIEERRWNRNPGPTIRRRAGDQGHQPTPAALLTKAALKSGVASGACQRRTDNDWIPSGAIPFAACSHEYELPQDSYKGQRPAAPQNEASRRH